METSNRSSFWITLVFILAAGAIGTTAIYFGVGYKSDIVAGLAVISGFLKAHWHNIGELRVRLQELLNQANGVPPKPPMPPTPLPSPTPLPTPLPASAPTPVPPHPSDNTNTLSVNLYVQPAGVELQSNKKNGEWKVVPVSTGPTSILQGATVNTSTEPGPPPASTPAPIVEPPKLTLAGPHPMRQVDLDVPAAPVQVVPPQKVATVQDIDKAMGASWRIAAWHPTLKWWH